MGLDLGEKTIGVAVSDTTRMIASPLELIRKTKFSIEAEQLFRLMNQRKVSALVIGLVFGIVFAAIGYAFTRGRRDFSSATAIVAGRYDILCEPNLAPQARDMIAQMGTRPSQNEQRDSAPRKPQH